MVLIIIASPPLNAEKLPSATQQWSLTYEQLHSKQLRDSQRSHVKVIPSIDHEIVRQLIRYDKEFARDSCIIKALTVKGFALGNLLDIFPVNHINTPDAILSQLFYFGMVTIDGTYQGNTRFAISNEAARNQMNTLINYGEEIIQGGKE